MNKKMRRHVTRAPRADKNLVFSYADVALLEKFVNEQGSIMPRARTGLSQKQQRRLAASVKHARHLALLPFTPTL